VLFARVRPEHKLRVVECLQKQGHVVAVTGDGVNDAPALKRADIGVAMGASGSDVAREASDLILLDDSFASIVNAIEEGRTVFANVRRFSTYVFTSNAPEAIPFIAFALSGGRIPPALDVMRILAVDLGTDVMPAVALGAEPPAPGLMLQKPRRPDQHLIDRALLVRAYLWLGIPQALAVMGAFYFQYWRHGYAGQWLDLPGQGPLYALAASTALATVVGTQVGNLFVQRTDDHGRRARFWSGNRFLWFGVASEVALFLVFTHVRVLRDVLGVAPLDLAGWLFAAASVPLLLVADRLRKWAAR
jgi:magnesium-transporting ATPase (P-type)